MDIEVYVQVQESGDDDLYELDTKKEPYDYKYHSLKKELIRLSVKNVLKKR